MDNKPCHVVLGATGGIGSELCRQLIASGASVVAAGRNSNKLRELAEALGVRPFMLDATATEEVTACLADAQQTFGRVGGDVAAVMTLLFDPRQSWITGQVFGIDGGLSTLRTRGKS